MLTKYNVRSRSKKWAQNTVNAVDVKPTLTPKQEKFCQQIVAGKNQSDAYRAAFCCKRMKPATINSCAYELMKRHEITARVKALMIPVVAQAQVQRVDWMKKAERFYFADVRKMYDEFGNVKDVPTLGDNEAAMIAGFEVTEDYTKVRLNDGSQEAVPVGYTKKIKLVDPMKAHEYFGRVMGFIKDDDGDPDKGLMPPRVEVIFVDAPSGQVQVNTGSSKPPIKPKVHFVG